MQGGEGMPILWASGVEGSQRSGRGGEASGTASRLCLRLEVRQQRQGLDWRHPIEIERNQALAHPIGGGGLEQAELSLRLAGRAANRWAPAAGQVDISFGGDQGGSIRLPAAFCGTFGMKPTDP